MSTTESSFFVSQKRLVFGITFWAVLTAAGFTALAFYSATPGEAVSSPAWDRLNLPFPLPADKHLLVMAIHPKCPCTRASVGELARLIRYAEGKLACQLLIYQPPQAETSWQQTGLLETASNLPQTNLLFDTAGNWAKQLGMATSGSVVVYAPSGEPVFTGGITAARNHHGDNLGSDTILSILAGSNPTTQTTAVYGCRLSLQNNACLTADKTCCEKEQP